MEKLIKFRLFHYYEDSPNAFDHQGNPVLVERMASFGQVVDIPREEDIKRGENLGAFFTDEELQAFKDGELRGPTYESLRSNAVAQLTLGDGAGVSGSDEVNEGQLPSAEEVAGMDSEEVAEIIQGSRTDGKALTVDQTVKLAGKDPDAAEVVLDAEGIASEGDPRAGVEKALEKIISDATSGANS